MTAGNGLLLPDLAIKGFRGIEDLTIPRLGRVTLLAGKNGIGKTTVLEAVRIYASRGRPSAISGVLNDREEYSIESDREGNRVYDTDWTALFNGRDITTNISATIGPSHNSNQLVMKVVTLDEEELSESSPDIIPEEPIKAINVAYNGSDILRWALSYGVRKSRRIIQEVPPPISCQSIGPRLLTSYELAKLWDTIALYPNEDKAVQSLNIIEGLNVDRVTMIGDNMFLQRRPVNHDLSDTLSRVSRRPIVKLKGQKHRVTLNSLGDGAARVFAMALSLANIREGFLLVDEVENGIHYSIQRDFWRMVLQTAHGNNVQVIATTHSSDCIKGFAQAAQEHQDIEGILIRLTRRYGPLRAVEYSEADLLIAAEIGTEVR